jgi:putative membrane protein
MPVQSILFCPSADSLPPSHRNRKSSSHSRAALWAVGAAGLAIAIGLLVRDGLPGILRLLDLAGWRLLWLVPVHVISLTCYGAAWRSLLRSDHRPGLSYLTWGAIVRESVSGLLPVARVGGEVVGVRLLARRGVPTAIAGTSVVVELTLTIAAQVIFAATGLVLLATTSQVGAAGRLVLIGLVVSLVALAGFVFVLRRWGSRLFTIFARTVRTITGTADAESTDGSAAQFQHALETSYANHRALAMCGIWQLIGFFLQSAEAWVMLRIMGAPATLRNAIVLESMTNAVQSAMFLVPAGLGTQEGGFLLFGAALGLGPQVALALALARRVRQLLLGVPALVSWYWTERRGKSMS